MRLLPPFRAPARTDAPAPRIAAAARRGTLRRGSLERSIQQFGQFSLIARGEAAAVVAAQHADIARPGCGWPESAPRRDRLDDDVGTAFHAARDHHGPRMADACCPRRLLPVHEHLALPSLRVAADSLGVLGFHRIGCQCMNACPLASGLAPPASKYREVLRAVSKKMQEPFGGSPD